MEHILTAILLIIATLSVFGTRYHMREGNRAGVLLGGAFTSGIIVVSLLALCSSVGLFKPKETTQASVQSPSIYAEAVYRASA